MGDGEAGQIGIVSAWNSPKKFHLKVIANEGWSLSEVQIWVGDDPAAVPLGKGGNLKPGKFPYKTEYDQSAAQHDEVLDLSDDLGFSWGSKSLEQRTKYFVVHADVLGPAGETGARTLGTEAVPDSKDETYAGYLLAHPKRGQFIDAPVQGLLYSGPTQVGVTGDEDTGGGFLFFPEETVTFAIGASWADDPFVLGSALAAQKVSPLDLFVNGESQDPRVVGVARILQSLDSDGNNGRINIYPEVAGCFAEVAGAQGFTAEDYADEAAVDVLLNSTHVACNGQGGAFLPLPVDADAAVAALEDGLSQSGIFRKNVSKDPDFSVDKLKLDTMSVYMPALRADGTPSLCMDQLTEGVSYQQWMDADGNYACDPREEENCQLVELECRPVAKPIVVTYMQRIDLSEATTDFWDEPERGSRFAHDIFTAISRDDGATWKRMNVSRMADLSSFDLESTGEPFPGTCRAPQMKQVGNKVLVVWNSTYCRGGRPRYAIEVCEDTDGDGLPDPCEVCKGGDAGNQVCELDYPYDDPYYVEDIWGVSGHQGVVNYDEVDEVAELGIGEIPYSCMWAARGVVVSQADLEAGKFASLDNLLTPEVEPVVGDIVWFKPERLTSGRRDAYIPVVGAVEGSGFAVAWQEDPEGLRPGKGKGPGQGWSGAISNHKTDIWYSWISYQDFDVVDEDFVPGGEPDEERPGLGRPKALVPMSLPVRVSDNDMVNTDTLKVELDGEGLPVIDPVTGTFIPLDPADVEHGNATGTKRYAYLAKDDPLYAYYEARGGVLDLCDTTGSGDILELLPGTAAHERWYRFLNTEGSEKTVCITADGRLMDGDISASRPNMALQPYSLPDGTKSAWVLLAYEESKGMGQAHAEDAADAGGQVPKPIKQDYGKNVVYHSFDFTQPDLVAPGHIVNLPALCGGVYETYCDDPDNPACTCTPGDLIPVYFDDAEGEPDIANFMQYRTEVARRVRFIVQSKSRMKNTGTTNTAGVIIYKQGQEGQGRPADVFIRRFVVPATDKGTHNPYRYENYECNRYLDESEVALTLSACPTDGVTGYNCNVWGEASGDRLCGGVYTYTDPFGNSYLRRDHVNLTSADIDLSVDAGPDDATPDDPTDDIYGTDKVLLWSQNPYNLGDESFGGQLGSDGLPASLAGMFSNSRSHRGIIRGDFLVTGFSFSPNWAAARNGRDRYNFYVRKSFDGGQTWTTNPEGEGVYVCGEYRTDPDTHEPPVGAFPDCDPADPASEGVVFLAAGAFEPARNVSGIDNNKETDMDPRIAGTPPTPTLDGTAAADANGQMPRCSATGACVFVEDDYVDSAFFVAWGTGDNAKSTGGTTITPEATPLDLYYTRSADYGDTYYQVPWEINGSGNYEPGTIVWRYDFMAHGEEEQGEAQIRATPDGSKMYAIWHQLLPAEEDPDAEITRWYPWEPGESHEDDVWFRRVIFPDEEVAIQ